MICGGDQKNMGLLSVMLSDFFIADF